MPDKRHAVSDVAWFDLTSEKVREFYENVVGWESSPVSMGDYDDYSMLKPSDKNPAAGICHARGENASLPAQWLIYIVVEDIEKSISECLRLGGKVINEPRKLSGYGEICVIQDPAGAVAAFFQEE